MRECLRFKSCVSAAHGPLIPARAGKTAHIDFSHWVYYNFTEKRTTETKTMTETVRIAERRKRVGDGVSPVRSKLFGKSLPELQGRKQRKTLVNKLRRRFP